MMQRNQLSGYRQQGLGPEVCMCGFVYPWKAQSEWTAEEVKSAVAHQQMHLANQLANLPGEPENKPLGSLFNGAP